MQFLVKAYDGEGMLEKRIEVRPRHLEGMKRLNSHIICAGGLLDGEGKMKGSVLIMDFSTAKTWMLTLRTSRTSWNTYGKLLRSKP